MTMQTTTTEMNPTTDPKLNATKAELDRLDEHQGSLKAEFDKSDVTFTREPTAQAFANRAVAEQKWKNATAAADAKRAELDKLLEAERKAARQRLLVELFKRVNPETTVAPHTARAGELIRTFVQDFTAEISAMATAAAAYNATLPEMNELGGGGAKISLGPELAAIQKAIADLSGGANEFERLVRLAWVNSSPPFWKLEINVPGGSVHSAVRP
jgi:hypothetical protein